MAKSRVKKPEKSRIGKLLESAKGRKFSGGRGCATCNMTRGGELEEDCREYFEAFKTGETAMPFVKFVDEAIREHYGFELKAEALMRHLRRCRGWQV